MKISDFSITVTSKQSFIEFLKAFIIDLEDNKQKWENPDLGRFLEAMERFLTDSKLDFDQSDRPDNPWALIARIFIAASVYE
jgi:hypothetical protein